MRVCRHVCVCTYLMYYVEFIYVSRRACMHVICACASVRACVSLHACIECPGMYMLHMHTYVCMCVCILPSVYFHYIFEMVYY